MTTAQVLFQQYQVLPRRIRQELKALIIEAEKPPVDGDDDDNGDTIRISMKALKDTIRDVKSFKVGKQKTRSAREALAEIKRELSNEH